MLDVETGKVQTDTERGALQYARKNADELIGAVTSLRRALADQEIDERDLASLRDVTVHVGGQLGKVQSVIGELAEPIRQYGLASLVALADERKRSHELSVIKLRNEDKFSWLVEHRSAVTRYGPQGLTLLARTMPKSKFGGGENSIDRAMKLAERLKDLISRHGILIVVLAIVSAEKNNYDKNIIGQPFLHQFKQVDEKAVEKDTRRLLSDYAHRSETRTDPQYIDRLENLKQLVFLLVAFSVF